jgi:Na+/melibiose symporter-like transporter
VVVTGIIIYLVGMVATTFIFGLVIAGSEDSGDWLNKNAEAVFGLIVFWFVSLPFMFLWFLLLAPSMMRDRKGKKERDTLKMLEELERNLK